MVKMLRAEYSRIIFYIKIYAHDILYGNAGIHRGDCQNILTAGATPDPNWVM